ncbi:MAG TPA: histidine ammonia-lyase, partial [Peptococcaceae bacterium]|nr:histidine ammonia-lyase [Peptococcaceae bacterium]
RVSELANISERRLERMVNPALNGELPPFLTRNGGLNSGLMLLQYAAAALVSENKVLSHPASVDSIPTSGNQEDHVSMGSIAALKLRTVVENLSWVIAAEMLAASRAMAFISHKTGRGVSIANQLVLERVPFQDQDQILYQNLNKVHDLVLSGLVIREVERELGDLLD